MEVAKDRQETMQASCALICNRIADAADDEAMLEIVTDQLMPWWHAHVGFDATSDSAIEEIVWAQKSLIHVEAINITANNFEWQTETPYLDAAMAIAYPSPSNPAFQKRGLNPRFKCGTAHLNRGFNPALKCWICIR